MDIRCGDRITFRVRMAASFQIFILYGIEGGNEPDLGSVITQPDFPSVKILERLPESLRITVCQYRIVCGPFSHHNGIPFRVGGNISGIIQLKNGTGSEGALQENDGIPILNVKACLLYTSRLPQAPQSILSYASVWSSDPDFLPP